METVTDFIFLGSQITGAGDYCHEIKRHLLLGRKTMTNLDSVLKSRNITLLTKVCIVKAMVFPVLMYGCESWTIKKKSWAPKNWCFWTVVLEKILESPLDCKEINSKVNQPWIFIGRTEAEASIFWPSDVKSRLIEKDPAAGKNWKQEEKGVREDEMVGWRHQLNGHCFRANSGKQWRTGKPGVLQAVGSQRVGHDWATENQQQMDLDWPSKCQVQMGPPHLTQTTMPGTWAICSEQCQCRSRYGTSAKNVQQPISTFSPQQSSMTGGLNNLVTAPQNPLAGHQKVHTSFLGLTKNWGVK